ASVRARLPMYKLTSSIAMMQSAAYHAARSSSPEIQEAYNRRYNAARDFLTFHMNRHSARRLDLPSSNGWKKRLFFLDLDGVFDWEFFGPFFPITTASGLLAVRLL